MWVIESTNIQSIHRVVTQIKVANYYCMYEDSQITAVDMSSDKLIRYPKVEK